GKQEYEEQDTRHKSEKQAWVDHLVSNRGKVRGLYSAQSARWVMGAIVWGVAQQSVRERHLVVSGPK
ncbi:hypothetical protein M9458_053120, partial [Cirrhinus mrigala]